MSIPQNLFGDDIATDESIVLLRRMVKLLESSGNNDIGNRQRVTVDAMTPGMILSSVSTVSSVTNIAATAGLDQRQFADTARIAYNTGIRQNLIFS